ncbi:MAG TPA: PspA/IM30 family protein [Candidatus Dormibacteraeota bacterium]|jgi:phage shock protein A|nr:PspA/IM30 family protein [Candidatus Dormibacteraeota bacterium]
MGLWSRIRLLFATKASSAIDRAEDPREVLDYAYSQQQLLLVNLRRGLVDVATSKQQLEQQAEKLRASIPRLDDQARRALTAGREDLARIALERKRTAAAEAESLSQQLAEVDADKDRLAAQERALQVRIEQFRTHRDVVSARYSAAEAEVRVKESLAGVSGELAELGMAVGRAEEKADRLQARARAIDSLIDVGSLPAAGGGDYVETELLRLTAGSQIDGELARLKAELATPQLETSPKEDEK